jgi:ribosomal protein RSM22 (predicted rRNA methylase)
LLDLGGGPGTSAWAAVEVFPSLEHVTIVERDAHMVAIGKRLATSSGSATLRNAEWIEADLKNMPESRESDLVVISYALGELGAERTEEITRAGWKLAAKALAVIEPGTVRGFGHVLAARTTLISAGAPLVAPCPHEAECPMAAAGDWCHFAQRVERTAEHRRLKSAELGYEDEKFSYVAAARMPFVRPEARMVRHPQKRSGHVELTLCTAQGLQRRIVGRSEKRLYRAAREAQWGSPWDESGGADE